LWVPAEPLIDPGEIAGIDRPGLSAAKLFAASSGNGGHQILRKIHDLASDALRGRLSEILTFVDAHGADLVVLHEYLIPVSSSVVCC
jgi:hypothetical protein